MKELRRASFDFVPVMIKIEPLLQPPG